jgi:hypothetical protein
MMSGYIPIVVLYLATVASGTVSNSDAPTSADISFPDIELERVAFGSCNKQSGLEEQQAQAWRSAAAFRPQLWLWTGDAVYSKNLTVASLEEAFRVQASVKPYQDFLDGKQQLQYTTAAADDLDDDDDDDDNDKDGGHQGSDGAPDTSNNQINQASTPPTPILVDGVWVCCLSSLFLFLFSHVPVPFQVH